MSLRDMILDADDRPALAVDVPEWGCTVYVQTLSGHGRTAWLAEVDEFQRDGEKRLSGMEAIKLSLLIKTLADEDGVPIFARGDREVLAGRSAKVLDTLFQAAQKVNAFTDDEAEEIAGNLPEAETSGSGTS